MNLIPKDERCRNCQGEGSTLSFDGVSHASCSQCLGTGYKGGHAAREKARLDPSRRDGCFPATAKVSTPFGLKNISDISVGDKVTSFNAYGKPEDCEITRVLKHEPSLILKVDTTGTDFEATGFHSVKTVERGWQKVSQLKTGDTLPYVDNNGVILSQTVNTVVSAGRMEPVYNLIVAGSYTFSVEGCIAHSFTRFRTIRVFLHETTRILKGMITPKMVRSSGS